MFGVMWQGNPPVSICIIYRTYTAYQMKEKLARQHMEVENSKVAQNVIRLKVCTAEANIPTERKELQSNRLNYARFLLISSTEAYSSPMI